jgi:hypothetical protein
VTISAVGDSLYWNISSDHLNPQSAHISPTGCTISLTFVSDTSNPSETYHHEENVVIELSGVSPTATLHYILQGGSNCTVDGAPTFSSTP